MPSAARVASAALLLALLLTAAATAEGEDEALRRGYRAIGELAAPKVDRRQRAARELLALGDRRWLAPLVDQLFFTPPRQRDEIQQVLAGLAGERHERYLDWVDYLGDHPELRPPPGYLDWKGTLFARIDPRFAELLREGQPTRIRGEEIVSGGVRFDGIPALERPANVTAERATLPDEAVVFAATVGGEARAWPEAVLSWHEMLNDRLGGVPVTLSYCTLCRTAVLFAGRLTDGTETTFGTSGLLYRSNKLMFDRATLTLWSNLTGEPVLGKLAAGAPALTLLPLVRTTWGAWKRAHPRTTAMESDPALARRHGFDYRPGAADARRAGVAFPVPGSDARLPERDEVWGLRVDGVARAYPQEALLPALVASGVVADAVGDQPVLLLLADDGGLRAYRRGDRRFRREGSGGSLRDQDGALWLVGDDALQPADGAESVLQRLPILGSYWFAWRAFHPATELWREPTADASPRTP